MSVSNVPRRRLLALMTWALGGAAAAIAGVPVLGALLSPLRRDERGEDAFVRVIELYELAVNVPRRALLVGAVVDAWSRQDNVARGAAWLIKQPSGEVIAFSATCPHLGCSINLGDQAPFACPCHASSFALNGTVTAGPSPRPMDRLRTQQKDGWLWVRPARFKQGVSAVEET